MYQLVVYVPESHLEAVKRALFSAGAGRYKNYEHCCWQVLGQGQYRPLENSHPHVGKMGALETLSEYRVELICDDKLIQAAITALKTAHPYEEPAYHYYPINTAH